MKIDKLTLLRMCLEIQIISSSKNSVTPTSFDLLQNFFALNFTQKLIYSELGAFG